MQHFNEPQKAQQIASVPLMPQTEEQKGDGQTNVFAFLSLQGQQVVGEYVAHLERGLAKADFASKALSTWERDDALREIQNHLAALIVAYQELGDDEPRAIRSALTQFGNAREIGNRLKQTRRRERFVAFGEIALFSAAFSVLFDSVERVVRCCFPLWVGTMTLSDFLLRWPLSAGLVMGIVALIFLVSRHGGRGIVRKVWGASPTGAAIRWLLLMLLLSLPLQPPFSTAFLKMLGIAPQLFDTNVSIAVAFFGTLSLFASGSAAYLVGRISKNQKSVANGVGIAVTVGAIITFLETVYQFTPASGLFSLTREVYLENFASMTVWGLAAIFVTRFCVQAGEARQGSHRWEKALP